MSGMNGNEQYGNGEWLADKAETQVEGLAANAFATLALAYEQRTANLIAFHAAIPGNAMDRSSRRLRADIMDRLGLEAAP